MYRFGACEVDTEQFIVRRDGDPVHVEPQVYDVIVHLLRHRDRVVTKDELLDAVWGDRFVSASALASRINAARKALGDDGTRQAVIKTAFGRGYQFVAEVEAQSGAVDGGEGAAAPGGVAWQDPAGSPTAASDREDVIRFVTVADGSRLAFARSGAGPVLVKAANWMTHLQHDRESEVWRHWIEGLSARSTLIRYDERGCGLSDWNTDDFGFDTWVDDLGSVVDDLGLERFPLLGISQGAAVAIAYAARHPERVSGLLLVGAYPRGRLVRATSAAELRAAALDLELARAGWGVDESPFMQAFASQFIPDGSRQQWDEFNALQARTTSAANAVRFLETFATIDVTPLAPQVRCPVLLVHSRDEIRVPASNASELASLIPGAELILLPSRNHILQETEPAWPRFLGAVDRFLAGVGGGRQPQ